MEAEVPVDAPVDVTNEAVATEVDEVEVQNVDVDDAIIVELSNKVELQAIIDSLMSAEQSGTMLDALAQSIEKQTELEVKFLALAKSIGSDFSAETKENKVNVKASLDKTSRAFQILNS
jgi:hypothetical protein